MAGIEQLKEKATSKTLDQVTAGEIREIRGLPKDELKKEREFLKQSVTTLKELQELRRKEAGEDPERLKQVQEVDAELTELEKVLRVGLLEQATSGGRDLLRGTGQLATAGLEGTTRVANRGLDIANRKLADYRAYADKNPWAWGFVALPMLLWMGRRAWLHRKEGLQNKADAARSAEGGKLSFKRHPLLWTAGILGIIGAAGTYAYGTEKAKEKITGAVDTVKAKVAPYTAKPERENTEQADATTEVVVPAADQTESERSEEVETAEQVTEVEPEPAPIPPKPTEEPEESGEQVV